MDETDIFETPDNAASSVEGLVTASAATDQDLDPLPSAVADAACLDASSLSAVDAFAKFRATDLQKQQQLAIDGNDVEGHAEPQQREKMQEQQQLLRELREESALEKLYRIQFELEQLKALAEGGGRGGLHDAARNDALFPGHSVTTIASRLDGMQSTLNSLYASEQQHRQVAQDADVASTARSPADLIAPLLQASDPPESLQSPSASSSQGPSATASETPRNTRALLQLEQRIAGLEQLVGAGGGVDGADLSSRLTQMEHFADTLNEERLVELQAAVSAVTSTTSSAGASVPPDNRLYSAKLGQLLQLVRQWEQPALLVPHVVDRLESLALVHQRAGAGARSLDSLEGRVQELTAQLAANQQVRRDLLASLQQNMTTMTTNLQSIDERLKKVISNDKK